MMTTISRRLRRVLALILCAVLSFSYNVPSVLAAGGKLVRVEDIGTVPLTASGDQSGVYITDMSHFTYTNSKDVEVIWSPATNMYRFCIPLATIGRAGTYTFKEPVKVRYENAGYTTDGVPLDLEITMTSLKVYCRADQTGYSHLEIMGIRNTGFVESIAMVATDVAGNVRPPKKNLTGGFPGVAASYSMKLLPKKKLSGDPVVMMRFVDVDQPDYTDFSEGKNYKGAYTESVRLGSGFAGNVYVQNDCVLDISSGLDVFKATTETTGNKNFKKSGLVAFIKGLKGSFTWTGSNCASYVVGLTSVTGYPTIDKPEKSVDKAEAKPGEKVTYTITQTFPYVIPGNAAGTILVRDTLDAALDPLTATWQVLDGENEDTTDEWQITADGPAITFTAKNAAAVQGERRFVISADVDKDTFAGGTVEKTADGRTVIKVMNTAHTIVNDVDMASEPVRTDVFGNPAISLTKRVDQEKISGAKAGDEVLYTFDVVNTGNLTLADVKIEDALAISDFAFDWDKSTDSHTAGGTLSPGERVTASARYALTQADIDARGVKNTAEAFGTDPAGRTVKAKAEAETVIETAPGIALEKTVDLARIADPEAGDRLTYSFLVTNTGDVTLKDIDFTDDHTLTDLTWEPALGELAPGKSAKGTAVYSLTQADIDAGGVLNKASVSGRTPSGEKVSAEAEAETELMSTPGISLAKTTPNAIITGAAAGDTVPFDFLITNTGNVTLTGTELTDSLEAIGRPEVKWPEDREAGVLLPGESVGASALYPLTQADIDAGEVLNTAAVKAEAPDGTEVRDEDEAKVLLPEAPGIDLVKTVSGIRKADGTNMVVPEGGDPSGNENREGGQTGNDAEGGNISGNEAQESSQTGNDTEGGNISGNEAQEGSQTGNDGEAGSLSGNEAQAGAQSGSDSEKSGEAQDGASEDTGAPEGAGNGNDALQDSQSASENGEKGSMTEDGEGGQENEKPEEAESRAEQEPLEAAAVESRAEQEKSDAAAEGGESAAAGEGFGHFLLGTLSGLSFAMTGRENEAQAHVAARNDGEASDPADYASQNSSSEEDTALLTLSDGTVISDARPGDVICYAFSVTNTGNVTLNGVTIADELAGITPLTYDWSGASLGEGTLLPGETITASAEYRITQADINRGRVDNVAVASGQSPRGTHVEDDGEAGTGLDQSPAFTVVKTVDREKIEKAEAGDILTYTLTMANTGNVTLYSCTFEDSLEGIGELAYASEDRTLEPGEVMTATASYAISQADIDRGFVRNTVLGHADGPDGNPLDPVPDEVITELPPDPAVLVVKTADRETIRGARSGDVIRYSFTGTNTGNVTLSDVALTDELEGISDLQCDWSQASLGEGLLLPGESFTAEASYALTQEDIDLGEVANHVVISGTGPQDSETGERKTVTDEDDAVTELLIEGCIEVTKTADPVRIDGAKAGDKISYSMEGKNMSNVTLRDVTLEDELEGISDLTLDWSGASLGEGILLPGESVTAKAVYTVTQKDVDAGKVENLVLISGTTPERKDGSKETLTDEDVAATVLLADAAMKVEKNADKTRIERPSVGDAITYTIKVTNTGLLTLHSLKVTDSLEGLDPLAFDWSGASLGEGTLLPGESVTAVGTYRLTQKDIDSQAVRNVAVAEAETPDGSKIGGRDEVRTEILVKPSISLSKTVDKKEILSAVSGSGLRYGFTVTNTGNTTLNSVSIKDQLPDLEKLSLDWAGSSDPATGDGVLSPGETVTGSAEYHITEEDIESGKVVNTATAGGTTAGGERIESAAVSVTTILRAPAGTPSTPSYRSGGGTRTAGPVKTGDASRPVLYMLVMTGCAVFIFAAVRRRKMK